MFRLLFERSADAIWLLDPKSGAFVDCNEAAVGLMRAGSKERLLHLRPEQLSPPCQPDGTPSHQKARELTALTEKHGGYRFEWVARRIDGEEVPLEVLATPISSNGSNLHVIVSREITERKRAEAALRENETKFRLLFESSSSGVMILDPEKEELIDCNEAAVRMTHGGTREWLLSKTLADLAPESQPDGSSTASRIKERIAVAMEHGAQNFEWTCKDFQNCLFPLEVTLTPIRMGERMLLVIVARDITERKRSEAELRESQHLLASIAENISEAIYRTGPNHELIFANAAYLKMSGYDSLAEMQRIPREQLYAKASDRSRLLKQLDQHDCFRNEEIEYVRRDGHHWWGLSNGVAIRDPKTCSVLYHVGSVADITERKRADEKILQLNASLERRIAERTAELTASEARLRTLVEHAPEAIVVFDGETGHFLFGNAHACRIYGRAADELSALTPAHVSPEFQPDGRRSEEMAREYTRETLAGGAPVFEWMHRHSSGRLIPTEVRLVRLPGDGRNLIRASIADNSERRRRDQIQQATYQISEAVYTTEDLGSLFRQIHAIVKGLMPADNLYIALADSNGQTMSFPYMVDEHSLSSAPMPTGKGLTGYVLTTGKTLLAGPHNAAQPGGSIDVVIEENLEVVSHSCSQHMAAVWLGAPLAIQGRTFGVVAVQDYHNPLAYGEQEKRILTFVAGQIALAIDRKRSEQALRESEEKFRALFAASSQGVMLHDEKAYIEVNPAAVRILGYSCQDDLIGRHPRDTSPPIQPNGESSDVLAQKYIVQCMNEGSARFDWMARSAQGHDIPVEVILTRIEWGGRQIIQAAVHEIAERKKAEAELLKALAREKELSQLKSNFISMVSHEFRTPLGVILSSADILQSYFDQLAPAERHEQLTSIQNNTRRMAGLMEEVLLLGMADAGKMDFKPAPFDLKSFCGRVIDELLSATDRKCPIHFVSDYALDGAVADERLLQHIFTNLLANAVKYSAAQSPVYLEVQREGAEAVCRIKDSGIGIPEPDIAWMFNAFHRGRNAAHLPGTGLGLSIVKRCVELHQGKIKIESTVGEGTTVILRLPLYTLT